MSDYTNDHPQAQVCISHYLVDIILDALAFLITDQYPGE